MKIGSAKRKISETGLPSVMFCTVCLAGTVCAMRTSLSLFREGTKLSQSWMKKEKRRYGQLRVRKHAPKKAQAETHVF